MLTSIRQISLGVYDGPHATPPPSTTGRIYLGIDNVTDDGRMELTSIRYIADEHFLGWTKRATPQEDDIVFSYEATLHRYAIIPSGFDGCLGRRMALVRPNPSKVVPRFLYYYFLGPSWRSLMEANTLFGSTVNRIPVKRFPGFSVDLPSMGEQRRIAVVLSAYDELIENNQTRVRTLVGMSRSLFRQITSASAVSPTANAVSGAMSLGDVASFSKESMSPQNEPDATFDLYSFAACDDGRLPHPTRGADIQSSKFRVPSGAVLLPKLNPHIARTWLPFLEGDRPAICSTEFLPLVPRSDLPRSFLYALVEGEEFQRIVAVRADGTSNSHKRLKPDDVLNQRVVLPDAARVRQFAALADPIYEQCHVLRRSIQALRATRDLLLPRLLSGELDVSRVPDPAELTPESPP